MAKISRFTTTRITASLNADFRPDENVKDSFYLDGRIARKREKRGADISSAGEDRGFFYALFATHDQNIDTPDSETLSTLHKLTETIKTSNDKIDNEINDLADCAVEVGGRATIAREGVRQSYFAGVIVKEAEIAAVTTGGACALLYRNNAVYPLTGCDIDLVNADYHGNAIENMNDFTAGVAGTIKYSNIAQLQAGDALILCNKEVLEAVGQRELLKILYSHDDGGDVAAEIIDRARNVNEDDPLQILIASVEEVIPADRTSKINLGLFQAQKDISEQATTRYEPIKAEAKPDPFKVTSEPAPVPEPVVEDDPFKPSAKDEDEPFTPSFMTTSAFSDKSKPATSVDFSDLEEQDVSQVETVTPDDQSLDDDVPVFEPIVTSKFGKESDAFAAGHKYADDDYYDADEDASYSDDDYDNHYDDDHYDEWEDDRASLRGNRRQRYSDDEYYDDYDMYEEQGSGGSKAKQYVLYAVLGIVCIACLVALYFMLFKKDSGNKGTDASKNAQISESADANASDPAKVSKMTEEADIRTPISSKAPDADTGTDTTKDPATEESGDNSVKAGTIVYTTAGLRLRSSASTSSDDNIVITLEEGTALTVVAVEDSWYSVTTSDGTAGYVSSEYVSTTAP